MTRQRDNNAPENTRGLTIASSLRVGSARPEGWQVGCDYHVNDAAEAVMQDVDRAWAELREQIRQDVARSLKS